MTDRRQSIRHLRSENDSERVDAFVEQHLTQALAHESRRRRIPGRHHAPTTAEQPRRTR